MPAAEALEAEGVEATSRLESPTGGVAPLERSEGMTHGESSTGARRRSPGPR